MNIEQNNTTIDAAFQELLRRSSAVSPALAQRISEKYEQDRSDFSKAVNAWSPSKEPGYWAKDSCNKCHGRGIIGTRHVFHRSSPARTSLGEYTNPIHTHGVTCSCTARTYRKWLAEFRVFYTVLKTLDQGTDNDE